MEQASRKKIETSAAGTITFAPDVTVPSSAAHVLIADANARTLAARAG
jgi:hypothetical protein